MTSPTFQFGDFRLVPAARELRQGDRLVALPPRSFDCLTYLIEHRERAVGRDELISAAWGRVDVSDAVLAQALLRARRAVGDDGNEQRAIRTIPRFGYRWMLPVTVVGETEGSAGAGPADAGRPAEPAAPPVTRKRVAWMLVLIATAVVGALLVRPPGERIVPPTGNEVLVLPVAVGDSDSEVAWIRLGAMDYVISRLREVDGVKVLSSEQTLLLVGSDSNPTDAGLLNRLQLATHASHILASHATASDTGWSFVIDAYHDGGMRSYEARADNPLDAASIAVGRFVSALGITETAAPVRATASTELVQRMDAALLAGDIKEAHRLVDATPVPLQGDPAIRVRAGQIAFRAGKLDVASKLFEPLADDPAVGVDVRAHAQMGLGAVAVRQNRFDAAERAYSEAIQTLAAGSVVDAGLLGNAYSGRGVANGAQGRANEALADFGRARLALEQGDDRIGVASIDVNLGLVESGRGRYAEAEAAFDRAIAVFNRFDVRDNLAAALIGRADAQESLLDHTGALASSSQAWELGIHLENPLLKWRIAALHTRILLARGQLDAAQAVLGDVSRAAAQSAGLEALDAQLQLERGDVAAAERHLAAFLEQAEAGTVSAAVMSTSHVVELSAIAVRRGGNSALLERGLALLLAAGDATADRNHRLAQALGTAELMAARGDPAAAAHFSAALEEADRRGAPDALVATAVALVAYRLDRREGDQAAPLVGRLTAYVDRDYRAARAVAAFHRMRGDAERATAVDASVRKLAGERNPALPL